MGINLQSSEKKALLDYFQGDELAADVWLEKYALKSSKGNFLETSPDEMHNRMAREFFRIENGYGKSKINDKDLSIMGKKS